MEARIQPSPQGGGQRTAEHRQGEEVIRRFTEEVVTSTATLAADIGAEHLVLAAVDDADAVGRKDAEAIAKRYLDRVSAIGLNVLCK